MIFGKNNVFNILMEFESDRMSPRKSAKNGQTGTCGLNCKIFVNSRPLPTLVMKYKLLFKIPHY